jgi:hypothetical protein
VKISILGAVIVPMFDTGAKYYFKVVRFPFPRHSIAKHHIKHWDNWVWACKYLLALHFWGIV